MAKNVKKRGQYGSPAPYSYFVTDPYRYEEILNITNDQEKGELDLRSSLNGALTFLNLKNGSHRNPRVHV